MKKITKKIIGSPSIHNQKSKIKNPFIHFLLVTCVLSAVVARAPAAETPVSAVELLPGNATVAINLPNLPDTRKALAASDFGRLWVEPEMQLFVKPMCDEMLACYAEMRQNLPLLPDLAAMNGADLAQMRERLANPAKRASGLASAKGWIAAQKLLGGLGHLSVYLAAPTAIKTLLAQSDKNAAKISNALNKSGLDGIQSVMFQVGSRDTQLTLDLAVAIEGEPRGLMAVALSSKPLTADALKMVPEAATFCFASRIEAATIFKQALEHVTGKTLDLQAMPAQFSYTCPPKGETSLSTIGNFGQMIAGVVCMPMGMHGIFANNASNLGPQTVMRILKKLDFALFPSDEVIKRHIRPAASVLTKTEGGVALRHDLSMPTTGTLASGQGGIFGLAMMSAIAIPSLFRSRTAANEVAATASCKFYAEAQEIYRRTDWDADGVLEYAQSIRGMGQPKVEKPEAMPEPTHEQTAEFNKLKGSSGLDTRSGLCSNKTEGDIGLVDRTMGMAEGNPSEHPTPKAGYCFKILTRQGKAASGGERNYLAPPTGDPTMRNMTQGYALVAYPAVYDGTGRNTFVISNTATIYQKDLGPDTHKIVETMTEYNPDETWAVAE
ncbi:MAG: DUF2950 family protein [Planctomycetota bacterium]